MARGGPPHAQSIHSARIRDHALPNRGQPRLTIGLVPNYLELFRCAAEAICVLGYLGKRRSPEGKSERPARNLARWTRPFPVGLSGRSFEEKAPLPTGLRIRGLTIQYSSSMSAWCGRSGRTKHPQFFFSVFFHLAQTRCGFITLRPRHVVSPTTLTGRKWANQQRYGVRINSDGSTRESPFSSIS